MLKSLDKDEEIFELSKYTWYKLAEHSIFTLNLSKDELVDTYRQLNINKTNLD